MKKPRITVNVSDPHCGSIVGLMPPVFVGDDGNFLTHGKNYAQKWLWKTWESVWEEVYAIVGKDPFVLTVNGDVREGVHHGGRELIAQKNREHTRMAFEVLLPHAKRAARVRLSEGTECHSQDAEHDVAVMLRGEGIDAQCKSKWLFEINGILYDMTHHIGTTSRAYLEATTFSVTMGNAMLNQLRSEHRTARLFLRGHRHCGGAFTDGHGMLCVTPAWQMLTRHGRKVVPDSIPRPGIIVLDHRNQKPGRVPACHTFFVNPPQDEIEKA